MRSLAGTGRHGTIGSMAMARARTEADPDGPRADTRSGPAAPWWHHALGLWLPLVALTVLTVVLLASR